MSEAIRISADPGVDRVSVDGDRFPVGVTIENPGEEIVDKIKKIPGVSVHSAKPTKAMQEQGSGDGGELPDPDQET